MLSAALETSSLPLLGVNSPLTTKLVTYYHAVKIRDMISTTLETISLNIYTSWSTLRLLIAQVRFLKKNWTTRFQKCHIYRTRRRYSTPYCSIIFTIWSATGSASSTYLMNWSWSHFEHIQSPRMTIFAEGQYDLTIPRACATQFLEVLAKYSPNF